MKLHSVELNELTPDIFRIFDEQPPLLTAGDQNGCNTMTIGWCQLGTLWRKPVCTVYVRPERYTYGFMEEHDHFTVSFLPREEKGAIALCGTKSGRDLDKIRACGLTLRFGAGNAPFFEEAEWVLVCKKMYAQDLTEQCVQDGAHILPRYAEGEGGWHRMYIGEVLEAYRK